VVGLAGVAAGDVTRRQSNRLDRRLAPETVMSREEREALAARLRYEGIAVHKLTPGDYGFVPPVNPRPSKSPCDMLRPVLRAEASTLLQSGVLAGMFSRPGDDGIPKYVWAVDDGGEVYEAKTKPPDTAYHGYRLGEDEVEMRRYILAEWRKRCPQA
jgi:hypothetical protein